MAEGKKNDEDKKNDDEPASKTSKHIGTVPTALFLIAACYCGINVLSIGLKKQGVVEMDLHELVTLNVLPRVRESFEPTFSTWTDKLPFSGGSEGGGKSKGRHSMKKEDRPGSKLREEAAWGQNPIVMIPGFVTSGLELWAGDDCARDYFRDRIWGYVTSVKGLLMERDCIVDHLKLDLRTGSDPPGMQMRAAEGMTAADYWAANYWVWGKIIENLADVGYNLSNLTMASYDWRLAFPILEQRDGYFTKLRLEIEGFKITTGKKSIIMSHSLGGVLVHFFFAWVTTSREEGGGGGGKNWVDEHIESFVNIAGTHLGLPKAATSLLSGEIDDLPIKGSIGRMLEQFMGRKVRRDLWATWGSLWSMLPKGGEKLWNIGADLQHDNDEDTDGLASHVGDTNAPKISPLLVMTDDPSAMSDEELDSLAATDSLIDPEENSDAVKKALKEFSSRKVQSAKELNDFLLAWGSGFGPQLASTKLHSFDPKDPSSNLTWHDVTRTPLPHAPNMKIYCLYGVGIETERSYFYRRNRNENEKINTENSPPPTNDPPYVIDPTIEDKENGIKHGVKYSDGDSSVPLLSLGYMCADAWRRKDSGLNPSGSKVVIREYKNENIMDIEDPMRGGPRSADHVDILGNLGLLEDVVRIASGHGEVEDQIVSDIMNISKRVNEHPDGGLYQSD